VLIQDERLGDVDASIPALPPPDCVARRENGNDAINFSMAGRRGHFATAHRASERGVALSIAFGFPLLTDYGVAM